MRSLRFSRATRRTSILGIALAFAGTTLAAMAATPLFPDPVHKTAVGDEPRSTASGDFNGDGKLDLAVANRLSGDVSILLGQGDGTFGPQIRSAAGDGPVAVDVGDFNRDGRQDLAVAVNTIGGSGDASILLGNGDGTFAAPTRYRAGDKTFSIAVGDFNADGLQDLAVGNNTDCCGDVSVLVGAGDGTFGVDLHYNVLFEPTSIVVADFNRDGLQDMAVANHYGIGTLSVLIGNGRAGFDTILSYEAGANSISVADGDFDGDGILDLAVSNSTSNDISLFPGLGDGTFGPKRTFFAALNPRSLVVADFDGDGRQDLMFLGERSFSQRAMAVALLGRGDGTFVLGSESGVGEFAASISVADFNGDGRQDLAVSNPLSDDVWSMAGIGDGSFGLPTRLELRDNPISLVASDLNGDHLPDVAFEQYQAKDVGVALGRGDGSLVFAGEAGSTPWPPLAVGEINGDGTPDLVLGVKDTVYSVAPGLAVALGLGNGAFGPQTNIGTFDLSNPVDSVALGDFNGDGRIDLAVGRRQLFGQTAFVQILLGGGDGTFTRGATFGSLNSVTAMATGDLNGDGHLDLAAIDLYVQTLTGGISVFLGNGDGSFGPALRLGARRYNSIAVGDFNGDGRADLAVTRFGWDVTSLSGDVSVFLGFGDGLFGPETVFDSGFGTNSLVVADFDLDGFQDLAVAAEQSNEVSVLLGHGDGTFAPRLVFNVGVGLGFTTTVSTGYLAVADFDRDGDPDLAVLNASDIWILLNQTLAPHLTVDVTIAFGSTQGKGSGTVTWTTNREDDLKGFNIYVLDRAGNRISQNMAPIACEECVTGVGHTYTFIIPKHKSGHDVFVEAVHADGRAESFGPAVRR